MNELEEFLLVRSPSLLCIALISRSQSSFPSSQLGESLHPKESGSVLWYQLIKKNKEKVVMLCVTNYKL